jgi:hypothetical protein
VESYFNDRNQLEKKPADFVTWGRKVIREVKNALEKRSDGDYVSPRARNLESETGAKLTAD